MHWSDFISRATHVERRESICFIYLSLIGNEFISAFRSHFVFSLRLFCGKQQRKCINNFNLKTRNSQRFSDLWARFTIMRCKLKFCYFDVHFLRDHIKWSNHCAWMQTIDNNKTNTSLALNNWICFWHKTSMRMVQFIWSTTMCVCVNFSDSFFFFCLFYRFAFPFVASSALICKWNRTHETLSAVLSRLRYWPVKSTVIRHILAFDLLKSV